MLGCDAFFQPSGKFTSQAPWAHFVHALGINPDLKLQVLTRMPPRVESTGPRNYRVRMDIDGEVLCHIVNLFREDKIPLHNHKIIKKDDLKGFCVTSFGTIRWDAGPDAPSPPFTPGPEEARNSTRVSLGPLARLVAADNLMTMYQDIVFERFGVSDRDLAWPEADTTPLLNRIDKLQENLAKVQKREKPLLLTHRGLEDASRIRRRATTKGGLDDSFLKDVLRNIDETEELHRRATSNSSTFLTSFVHLASQACRKNFTIQMLIR
jgi:hypothetical protein